MMRSLVLSLAVTAILNLVSGDQPTVSPDDHLLVMLQSIHNSHAFHALPQTEKIIVIEMIAAAETDSITHYVDGVGFGRILDFLDHLNLINQGEAHKLEKYLIQELAEEEQSSGPVVIGKRDLQSVLQTITSNSAFQSLAQDDQDLMVQLAKAVENGTATDLVHQEGYSRIIALVEHIMSPRETHQFLHYLVIHLEMENPHHLRPGGPLVG